MRTMNSWIVTLGLAAATPGIAMAGPFGLPNPLDAFRRSSETADATQPSNQEMAEQVAGALRAMHLNGKGIEIEYQNGTVTLLGEVSSAAQQQMAGQVSARIPGVKNVRNLMTVAQGAPAAQTAAAVAPTAPQSANPFVQVAANPDNTAGSVEQAAFAGGTEAPNTGAIQQVAAAKSFSQKRNQRQAPSQSASPRQNPFAGLTSPPPSPTTNAVEQPAPNAERRFVPAAPAPAPEPKQVTQVSGGNQRVAENIAGALKQAGLSSYDIEVRFRDGVCTLNGSILSPAHKAAAHQAASSVSGVQIVQNNLTIAGGPAQQASAPTGNPFTQAGGYQGGPAPMMPAGFQNGPPVPAGPAPSISPAGYGHPGPGISAPVYNNPHVPTSAWPTYAQYPNYAAVSYPQQYSASAWPYIGPFHPYPQVPLGWRSVTLEWDDGAWYLDFNDRTERWWWFLDPKNW
ncbi:periplasmic protein [Calycomorphotria hydatis]|uniref:Periplasmic protein n=2 Tax=Calycomorphotria hydatis TaxID=2528027 RepID=A0A517TC25_9PLAN|nr:periplasmic protein [Calycomorphotria hydatis]